MSTITSHVLDLALGRPAVDVSARLDVADATGSFRTLAQARTDEQGRIGRFLPAAPLEARTYRIVFDTAAYFAATARPSFYPWVEVVFSIQDANEHHHIPLLLSPFGYSTYRGS